jgi:hypothetical protein
VIPWNLWLTISSPRILAPQIALHCQQPNFRNLCQECDQELMTSDDFRKLW